MKKLLMVVVLLTLTLVGYRIIQADNADMNTTTNVASNTSTTSKLTSVNFDDFEDIPPSYVDEDPSSISGATVNSSPTLPVTATSSFSCDGRQHCTQMTSCAEATYFIQHCPNTKMDGNNDGIPCEQQWCK